MRLALLFPLHLRKAMECIEKLPGLEEIRVRIGQPIFVYTGQKELVLVKNESIVNDVLWDSKVQNA